MFHAFCRNVFGYGHNALPGPNKDDVDTKISWSELDGDSLAEIMSKLSPADQARFIAVCKRWHSVRPITTYRLLPWFVSVDDFASPLSNTLEFCLYEPYSRPKFLVSAHKISLSELGIPFCWTNAIYSWRQGDWLFMSVSQPKSFFSTYRTYFFLLSPLTREVIQLPELDYPSLDFGRTFSTNPNSPDCVFLLWNAWDGPDVVIMTCRRSDKEWTVRKFDNFVRSFCRTMCINETLFVVSLSGQVASYDIMNGTFEIETLHRDDDFNSQGRPFLFELNGELTILHIGHIDGRRRRENNTFPGLPLIKKFDRCAKVWVTLGSLRDQTLFVGDDIKSIVKVGPEQAKNIGVLPNMIYYYFNLGCIIYSFENGVLVQSKYNATLKKAVEGGDLLQYQYEAAITYGDVAIKSYSWFEPPAIR